MGGFSLDTRSLVGRKIRDIYASHSTQSSRLQTLADDSYIGSLAQAVTGDLGGKVGIAPRVFLKKLVADVLDRIDQHPEFDPRKHYSLTIQDNELTEIERNARAAATVDEIELDP